MKEESKKEVKGKGKGKGKPLSKELHSDSESDESYRDLESDSSEENLEEKDMLSRCKMCKKWDGLNNEWIACDIFGQWLGGSREICGSVRVEGEGKEPEE